MNILPKGVHIMSQSTPIEIFFSYAHEDEGLRDQLAKQMRTLERQRVISAWHDRRITPGKEWAGQIDQHLNTARIILLLISTDFIDSNYCYDVELTRAMQRHATGEAHVIPIILRPCDWTGTPFAKLQALPRDAKPVRLWRNLDEAFLDIVKGIREVIKDIHANP